jgi:hypothetical protein
MSAIIDSAFAREFATEWVAAWNSGDLERIFSHYADDFEMRSPLIIERGFSPTGALHGKAASRAPACVNCMGVIQLDDTHARGRPRGGRPT